VPSGEGDADESVRLRLLLGPRRSRPRGPLASGGRTLDFAYDKAERLLSVTAVGAGHLLKELTYDDGATGTASRLDGRLNTATRHNWVNLPWDNIGADVDVEVTETYAYDGVGGRVSDRTTDLVRPSPYGTSTFTQSFTWTPLGDPDVTTYPTCTGTACPTSEPGLTLAHAYDAGYLTSLTSPPSTEWLEEIRYHPNGLWSEIDRGNNWTDRQTVAGNGMQRPLELSTENGLGQQQYTTGTFAYDGAGNVKAMGADSFTYDAHNRLASARIDGDDYSYAYDAYGNLSDLPRPGEAVSICIDSQKNRIEETLPEGESCKLLADQDYFGNLVELQGFEYEYDPLDMPIHRNPEPVPPDHTYVYTADEERIWFVNAAGGPPPGDGKTGLTAWEGLFLRDLDGKLLRQYSKETSTPFTPPDSAYTAPFTVSRDYLHRNGQLAAIREPGGVIRHQHLDHLGTPRAISAGNGALVSTHKYSPYGKELGGSSGNALQFTGHERDSHGAGEDDNLDYMHARFYSPYVGRFLSPDDLNGNIARPQTLNRYSYVLGNPVAYADPYGLFPCPGIPDLECHERVDVTADDPASKTGLDGLQDLLTGRSLMSALDGGLGGLRNYYQRRFEEMAVQGNYLAAFIDYVGLELLIPETGGELGAEVLMSVVPYGKLGRLAKIATRNIQGGKTTARAVLKGAERWLGPGYKEVAPGVYRSADGSRQFRMTLDDLTDPRGGHVHFESVAPDGRQFIENAHIQLVDP
jgi:RHS repeat-associated protein